MSSVDATKTVGSLTDTEAKQLCEDTQRFSDAQVSAADRKQVACGLGAQLVASSAKPDAEAKANCTALYDACLVRPLPTQGDAGATTNACDKAKDDLKDCAATVNELTTCTADNAASFKSLIGKDFCADVKAAALDAGASPAASIFPQPASCAALLAKCPGLGKRSSGSGG